MSGTDKKESRELMASAAEQVVLTPWEVLSSECLYDHPFIHFVKERIRHPLTGETMTYFTLISPVDTVAVVALTSDNQVLLTRQYRHPLRRAIYDLPAGRVEAGEDPAAAAVRELREETAFHAARWERLGYEIPYPGGLRAGTYFFLARELTPVPGGQKLDEHEDIIVEAVPIQDVLDGIVAGRYVDGALQFGVLMAARQLGL